MSLLKQSFALSRANLKSLPRRFWISLSMIFSVALVVTVLLGFLAMANGFRMALQHAGSDDIAIALGTGAASELGSRIEPAQLHFLSAATQIARDADSQAIMSRELVVPVDATEKESGRFETLSLRGIGDHGFDVRPLVRITEGRAFTPGAPEIVVGRRLSRDYKGLAVGDDVTFGTSTWKVVGMFVAEGSVFESEMFADAGVVQTLFDRPGLVQSARIKLTGAKAMEAFAAHAASTPQIALPTKSEKDYLGPCNCCWATQRWTAQSDTLASSSKTPWQYPRRWRYEGSGRSRGQPAPRCGFLPADVRGGRQRHSLHPAPQ